MNKSDRQTFRKDVDFVAKDDDEQVATGIVMVPDKVDLQHDFVREDLIREFADQFGDFVEVDQADGGIMHAAWPSDWMTLERNEVLDQAEEIGGKEAPAGAWVQRWKFNDDGLWGLVSDGILEGYSIGAVDVHWDGPFEQDELDDVDVPEEIGEDEFVWQIVRGIIREVSTVDIPAVPDAMILETKADAMKRLSDHLGNRDGFIEEAQQRGHTETEAERLWDVLNEAVDIEGAGEPGDKSWLSRAKAFFSAGGPGGPDGGEPDSEKVGQTLSAANRRSLFAAIDAGLDVLEDAGVDHGMTRFTDRDDIDFDLTEHTAREWPEADGDEEEESGNPFDPIENVESASDTDGIEAESHAPEGDTSDPGGGGKSADDMTDENENPDDPEKGADTEAESEDEKSLAEQNAEAISELTQSVEQLADAMTEEPEEKTAEIEIGGEVYEVTESEAKSWFEEADEAKQADALDDAPEHIQALAEKVEHLDRRLESANRQSGFSQQLAGGTGDGSRDGNQESNGQGKESALDELARALN